METLLISTFVIWFQIQEREVRRLRIRQCFRALQDSTSKYYNLVARGNSETHAFKAWFQLEFDLYLVHVPSSWSPGDICGYLKTYTLAEEDQVVAICIDQNRYIPHQGFRNGGDMRGPVQEWMDQAKEYYFESRDEAFAQGRSA